MQTHAHSVSHAAPRASPVARPEGQPGRALPGLAHLSRVRLRCGYSSSGESTSGVSSASPASCEDVVSVPGVPPKSRPSEPRSSPSPSPPISCERREQLLLGRRPRVRRRRHLVRRADLDRPVAPEAGRRRDQLPDDHVLLQPEQPVDLALDRRVGQHLRRLLEGGRREEGLRRERRLRDPEDQRLERRLLLLALLLRRARSRARARPCPRADPAADRCRPGSRPAPSSASAARSARCACRGCRRPATCTPSAPRPRGRARSRSSPCPTSRAARASPPGAIEPSFSGSPGSTTSPFFTSSRVRRGSWYSFSSAARRSVGASGIVIFGPRSVSSTLTRPPISASTAAPFGLRASKISTTRGRPCVMSAPATPPVWNVRIVSCVPGSPIDCAAMMPTASPISHSLARREEDAVAGPAHAVLGSALEHASARGSSRPCRAPR